MVFVKKWTFFQLCLLWNMYSEKVIGEVLEKK